LLRKHIAHGKVGFGINHVMNDYQNNRAKALDMVVCTPASSGFAKRTFFDLYKDYKLALTHDELSELVSLGDVRECAVGTSLVAVEAKACMTEHVKAIPRLYDELSSSYQVVNGDTNSSIAAGYVSINIASSFISPDRNRRKLKGTSPQVTQHKNQPNPAKLVYQKIQQLRRRSNPNEPGYDAIGISILEIRNDGTPASVGPDFGDGTRVNSSFTYDAFIERLSTIYNSRFAAI